MVAARRGERPSRLFLQSKLLGALPMLAAAVWRRRMATLVAGPVAAHQGQGVRPR